MKKTYIFCGLFLILLTPVFIYAQVASNPPVPVAEKEIRQGSIKMRSVELEKVKRDANKIFPKETEESRKRRFSLIKKDFESIQKTQDLIIRVYLRGKTINYTRISKLALKLYQDALQLDKNLFAIKKENSLKKNSKKTTKKSVKDLIVELDNSIGKFIENPIFKNLNVVNSNSSQKAQKQLRKIINISNLLTVKARDM